MPYVIAWLVVSAVGFVFAVFDLLDGFTDLRMVAQARISDARARVARGNVRTQAVRAAVLLLWVGAGVLALTDSSPVAIRFLLVCAATLVGADSVAERVHRHQVLRDLDTQEHTHA